MLFNSYGFIFLFLPIAFTGFFQLARINHAWATGWLALASLFFYGYWNLAYVGLLLGSIACNYTFGLWIAKARIRHGKSRKKLLLLVAITANLLLLAYYKYANFFVSSANGIAGAQWGLGEIILPLGISFFTFTQIAFLVDTYQDKVKEYNFTHYLLFVTYFPHLIAGPVLHHKQMMPQFANPATYRINLEHVAVGITIFVLGLSKKVLLADNFAEYATPIFNAARDGQVLTLLEAWIGALSYTLQLYFDFSGYSDMAIGLSLMFNVRLPINFDSPYKAISIIDFWRRWHITLSSFLRDYLYFTLGGNRKGKTRRYLNLMATMLLGGLWHGAGWTFVIWGGLHGLYLMVNHAWRELKVRLGWKDGGRLAQLAAGLLTFSAVVIAWVFFRSDSFTTAYSMLLSMFGAHGIKPEKWAPSREALKVIIPGLLLVWVFPNVRQMLANYRPTCEDMADTRKSSLTQQGCVSNWLMWHPTPRYAWVFGSLFLICVFSLTKVSEFLYFQF